MSNSFKDRLLHDEKSGAWFDQSRRYMMIRPDALMGIFRNLPEDMRHAALHSFADSISKQGGDSARAYVAMGGTGEKLFEVIAATAPELGWGRWSFEITPELVRLVVHNSPFADGYGSSTHPVCMPIIGMLNSVCSIAKGYEMTAREIQCAAMGAECCIFEAKRGGANRA